jgi:hypothetical protein
MNCGSPSIRSEPVAVTVWFEPPDGVAFPAPDTVFVLRADGAVGAASGDRLRDGLALDALSGPCRFGGDSAAVANPSLRVMTWTFSFGSYM